MIDVVRPYRYAGWPSCVRLANREVELVVTTDVGPRIIRYAPIGGDNALYEDPEQVGQTGGDRFRAYGGHRLWHAPEHPVRTYAPDNATVAHAWRAPWLELTAPVEAMTGIEKKLELRLAEEGSEVIVVHRLTNRGLWPIECAAWALTVMPSGGVAMIPQEPFVPFPERLTPVRPLVLWSYARMDDPRVSWGSRWIKLRADGGAKAPFKVGALATEGFAAYLRRGLLFIKKFPYREGADYPDFGCNFETFTNASMLELESLSVLARVAPGESIEHTERWCLYRGVAETADDAAIDRMFSDRLGVRPG